MSVVQHPTPAQQALYLPPGLSLPREQLATIQQILNAALRAATSSAPPPPYNPRMATGPWYRPRMDMYESSGVVTATFELPGLRKEDIHIDVVEGRMIIVGDRRSDTPTSVGPQDDDMADTTSMENSPSEEQPRLCEEHSAGYTVREIKRGRFKRVVSLPSGIRLEDIKAAMHDGILTVTFPGAPRPVARSIPIA